MNVKFRKYVFTLLLAVCGCLNIYIARGQHPVIQKTFGGVTTDAGYSIAATADSGIIMAGYKVMFGTGDAQVMVVRLDSNADTLWTRTFGGSGEDIANSIIQLQDGGFIFTGSTDSYGLGGNDVYVIRMDSNGDTLWTRTLGGADDDKGYCIIQTADGGYAIAGSSSSFGTGHSFYLARLDSLGNSTWTKAISRTVTAESEAYFICGNLNGSFTLS